MNAWDPGAGGEPISAQVQPLGQDVAANGVTDTVGLWLAVRLAWGAPVGCAEALAAGVLVGAAEEDGLGTADGEELAAGEADWRGAGVPLAVGGGELLGVGVTVAVPAARRGAAPSKLVARQMLTARLTSKRIVGIGGALE